MTKDEITKVALDAGLGDVLGSWCQECGCNDEILLRFAAMLEQRASAAEREACAKIADAELTTYQPEAPVSQYQSGIFTAAEHIAAAIRARSNP